MLVFGYALKYNSLKILIHANNVFVVSLKYPLDSPTSMTIAYMEVKNNNMSVRKAARQFSVPRQTQE
jgi:hypothetical protein